MLIIIVWVFLSKRIAFGCIESMNTVAYICMNIMSPAFGLNISLDSGGLCWYFVH